jgi:hypothetical protein
MSWTKESWRQAAHDYHAGRKRDVARHQRITHHPRATKDPNVKKVEFIVPSHEGCRLRLNIGFLPLPVDPSQMAMVCSLRSTGVTLASALLRSSPPLAGASVLSASRLEPLVPFPFASPSRFCRMPRGQSQGIPHDRKQLRAAPVFASAASVICS